MRDAQSIPHAIDATAVDPQPGPGPWTVADIAYERIDAAQIRGSALLFNLIAAASFVESTTPLYTRNLVRHLQDHPAAQAWLEEHWQPEEVRHGTALRKYVNTVWPEFDWERAYQEFIQAYAPVCTQEYLEPEPGLEMIARCVVEVGTSTYYSALGKCTGEPVLADLCAHIMQDEVRHYTYFFSYFREYGAKREFTRWQILQTILRRYRELENDDMRISATSIRAGLPADHPFLRMDYSAIRHQGATMLADVYPFRMAVLMLLKPLALQHGVRRVLTPLLAHTARLAIFH